MLTNSSMEDGQYAPQMVEETCKVLTSLQNIRTESERCDNTLKEHEEFKKNLKEKSLCYQTANVSHQEILNLSESEQKASFEGYSTIKENVKAMYYSIQRLNKHLARFAIERKVRELTLDENDACLRELGMKYDEKNKKLRCGLEKHIDGLCEHNRKLEEEIDTVASHFGDESSSSECIMKEHAELQKLSDDLKTKIKIQTEQLEIEMPEKNLALVEDQELAQIMELVEDIDAKISTVENEILCVTSADEDLIAAECRARIKDLDKNVAKMQEPRNDTEDPLHEELVKDIDCFNTQIEHTTTVLNEMLSLYATRTNRLAEVTEDEQNDAKTVDILSAELKSLQETWAETASASNMNPDDLALEDQLCTVKINNLLLTAASYESAITERKMKLSMLKTSTESKLQNIAEKIVTRDMAHEKTCDQEMKELHEIDSANKQLQEKVERLEVELEEKKTHVTAKTTEIDEGAEAVKSLELQADGIRIEMKRLEASKERQKELMPKPPLRVFKPAPAPPVDSDSSIDGEKLTYSQFMKRRRLNSKKRM